MARAAPPGRARHRTTILGLTLALGGSLVACDAGPDGSPEQVAAELAAGLESGDLGGVSLVDSTPADAAAQLERAHTGLGEAPLSVEVLDVGEPDEAQRAQARLRLTWDLPGEGADLDQEVALRMQVAEDQWVASWEHALLGVPRGQELRLEETPPVRADVVDRDGEPLATGRPVWRIGIDKTAVEPEAFRSAARDLAQAADLDAEPYAERVWTAGEQAFVELITYRQSDPDGQDLAAATEGIPGAVAIEDELVLGPTRTFAQPLLGTVGPVTQELLEQHPDRYAEGDEVGRSGLQAAFDESLRGEPGLRVAAVDADTGRVTDTLLERDPVAGDPLRLTLSTSMQRAAETALGEVGPASALVAIDHTTGDVLALANGPGSEGRSTALASQYPPGSTFKLASALGLLRDGSTPQTTVTCTESLVVDGYEFTNVPGYPVSALGEIPLTTAMANSCNTALIAERDRVPMEALAQAAADLGIGGVWDMPVTAFSGSVPVEAASETEHAASLIGQGRVLASPTAMAVVAATVAQGSPVVPRVVDGQEVPEPDGALSPEESEALRTMMRAVVTEGGGSMLADNPGPPVLAKTGTAEVGTDDPPRTPVWMVAVQGDLAVAVFVEEGERGSTTAGPIMDAFLTEVVEDG